MPTGYSDCATCRGLMLWGPRTGSPIFSKSTSSPASPRHHCCPWRSSPRARIWGPSTPPSSNAPSPAPGRSPLTRSVDHRPRPFARAMTGEVVTVAVFDTICGYLAVGWTPSGRNVRGASARSPSYMTGGDPATRTRCTQTSSSSAPAIAFSRLAPGPVGRHWHSLDGAHQLWRWSRTRRWPPSPDSAPGTWQSRCTSRHSRTVPSKLVHSISWFPRKRGTGSTLSVARPSRPARCAQMVPYVSGGTGRASLPARCGTRSTPPTPNTRPSWTTVPNFASNLSETTKSSPRWALRRGPSAPTTGQPATTQAAMAAWYKPTPTTCCCRRRSVSASSRPSATPLPAQGAVSCSIATARSCCTHECSKPPMAVWMRTARLGTGRELRLRHEGDNPVKVVKGAEFDDDAAFATAQLHLHPGIECVGQPLRKVLDAGRSHRARCGRLHRYLDRLSAAERHRFLGGPHRQSFSDDPRRQVFLGVRVLETE